jgi:hypothetical protein
VIAHTVLCRWSSVEHVAELDGLVSALPTQLPGITRVLHGASVSSEGLEGGYEWGMTILFATRADLEAYLPHPVHQPIAQLIGERSAATIVFDVDDAR